MKRRAVALCMVSVFSLLLSANMAHASYHYLEYADPNLPDLVLGMRHEANGIISRAVFVDKDDPEAVKVQHGSDYSIRVKPSPVFPLESDGWSGCSNSSPCYECQGDCDNNQQCLGVLECHQRDGIPPVPGCSGNGNSSYDYCVVPGDLCLDARDDVSFRPCENPLPEAQKWYFVVVPGVKDTFRLQSRVLNQCSTQWLDDYQDYDPWLEHDNPGVWQYFKIGRSAFQW